MRDFVKVFKELIKCLPTGLGLGHIKAFHPEGMWESCWEAGFSLGPSQANVWGCAARLTQGDTGPLGPPSGV